MPIITVTSKIITRFEVSEGVSIDLVRHQALSVLSENEEDTDAVCVLQDTALNRVYLGAADARYQSVEHSITEGDA